MTAASCGRVGRRRAPRTALVLFAAVVALAGAACGGDRSGGPKGAPRSVVGAAPGLTRAAGTAKVDIGVGERLAGSGVVRFLPDAVRARLRLAPVRAAAGGGRPVDLVLDGVRGWVRTPAAGAPPAGTPVAGAPWLPGTLPGLGAAAVSRLGADRAVEGLLRRPGAGLELAALAGATEVTTYGGAEVRGASTIRYQLTLDLDVAATAVLDGGGPATLASELRAAAGWGSPRFPADVWIDGRGRVRRLQLPADPTATATTVSADNVPIGVLTVDFYDFGAPATVEDPAVPVPS